MTDHHPNDKMKQTIKNLDNLDKSLQIPQPHFGGLITDPLPGRVRELEERVKRLEETLDRMDKLKWMMDEIEGGRL